MTTPKSAMCIIETKSDVQTQRNYRRDPQKRPTIMCFNLFMAKEFMETETVFDTRSGRPRTSEENIERVRQAFQRSSMKSIRTAARQLELPRSTVHKVLHKNLRLYAYKVQMLHSPQPEMPVTFALCIPLCIITSGSSMYCFGLIYCRT